MKKTLDELGIRLEARGRVVVAALAGLLFVGAVLGASALDGNSGKATGPAVPLARGSIEGFTGVAFKLTNSAGEVRNGCGLLADSDQTRAKGLMNVDSLAGFDGMIFRFPQNTNAAFYMANVRFPLSIAWFDENGRFVSSAEMPRCEVAPAQCPTYGPARPYRYALEVSQGDLDDVGAVNGSTLQVGNICS